nr:MAG TPA: putative ATPase [Caudoviricetes sp.]
MNQSVKELLQETLEKYGISRARAGREMGYSSSIVSAYMTGNYSGDVAKLEKNIQQWCNRQIKAHSRKKIPIVETTAVKTILNAISMAHTEHDIALIVADAGASKTTSAKLYADRNETTVVYIPVVAGMNRKMLVTEIARQLGVETMRVPLNVLIQQTAQALADRDSLVILDEADYLKADALEFCRRLVYDLGESGLVLMGLPRLRAMIQNLRNDHRQLESRIGISVHMEGLTKSDATLIAREVWPNCETEIINSLYDVSKSDVRQFVKLIERAQNTMVLNNLENPTQDAIEMAATLVLKRRGDK